MRIAPPSLLPDRCGPATQELQSCNPGTPSCNPGTPVLQPRNSCPATQELQSCRGALQLGRRTGAPGLLCILNFFLILSWYQRMIGYHNMPGVLMALPRTTVQHAHNNKAGLQIITRIAFLWTEIDDQSQPNG